MGEHSEFGQIGQMTIDVIATHSREKKANALGAAHCTLYSEHKANTIYNVHDARTLRFSFVMKCHRQDMIIHSAERSAQGFAFCSP